MIKITFYTKKDQYFGFAVSGHALYGEYGEDIVCSAVSVLAINTVNSIEKLTADEFENVNHEDKAYISLVMTDVISPETRILLESFYLGVTGVEEAYGNEYIQVEIEEV